MAVLVDAQRGGVQSEVWRRAAYRKWSGRKDVRFWSGRGRSCRRWRPRTDWCQIL